ncbi:MAG TPA: hypothetical protein VGS41_07255 [Chthonomonadales bacterium]|nr:hypothetical protein [Chthonomonadales bacterium]
MRAKLVWAWVVLGLSLPCAGTPASRLHEHFHVLLHVETAIGQADAFMDTTPPIGGVNPRPVVHAQIGHWVRVKWQMKSAYPHGVMKAVTVHFFVVREEAAGQKPVPNPAGSAGFVDNSLTMDFQPDGQASGAIRFHAPDAGDYLVRVQSENTYQEHGHEHFAAIDLVVS